MEVMYYDVELINEESHPKRLLAYEEKIQSVLKEVAEKEAE